MGHASCKSLRTMRGIWLAAALAAVSGCVEFESTDEDPDGETGTTDKITFNGLELAADALAELSTEPLSSDAGALVRTSEGRDLLEYVARCALPADAELEIDGRVFAGQIGLAPEWESSSCDRSCQGWVTACLLAHVNLNGARIPISLRGDHPALEPSEGALASFTLGEAAFYGNVFARDDGERDPVMLGCMAPGGISIDFDPFQWSTEDSDYLQSRVCGTGACNFGFAGWCYFPPPINLYSACQGDEPLAGYRMCNDGDPDHERYAEVITTYLASPN